MRPPPTEDCTDPTKTAALAVRALKAEAVLTPKPGLVDANGPGSHQDMDLSMLLRSADSLYDTFVELARVGGQELDRQNLRDRVGALGRAGEAKMLEATGGVNTHRGALWSIGLLVTAAAQGMTETDIFTGAASLARTPDSVVARFDSSHGQQMVRTYGVVGAVAEASAGFPNISSVALPTLRASLSHGESTDRAHHRALVALIATVDDTCVLHRGGMRGLRWMQESAIRVQRATHRFDPALEHFAVRARRRGLSPGGSGDLLAGAIFVDSLDRCHGTTMLSARLIPAIRETEHAYA